MNQLLRLEERNYNLTKQMMGMDQMARALGSYAIGKAKFKAWVAEIVDWGKFRFERKFLDGKWDFYEANSKLSRGVFRIFELESGKVYEVSEFKRRYFCTVDVDGSIREITQDEVEEWIVKKFGR